MVPNYFVYFLTAETQVGSSTVTAQTGGVISTPHMTGVNTGRDIITNITINNTGKCSPEVIH